MNTSFIHGYEDHISEYVNTINEANDIIILTSWTLAYIPEKLYKALKQAQERSVNISFIVGEIRNRAETLLDFHTIETISHAKFLIVDYEILIIGSFNALSESDGLDSSVKITGTIKQLWPFIMSIYETYVTVCDINEIHQAFGDSVHISRNKSTTDRKKFTKRIIGEDLVILLRNKKEHGIFFELLAKEKSVTIYSPFFRKRSAKKKIEILSANIPPKGRVCFKVSERDSGELWSLLMKSASKDKFAVEVSESHQKIVIIEEEVICVGSLNWLSMPHNARDDDSNVEFSIILQGPGAKEIIKKYFPNI